MTTLERVQSKIHGALSEAERDRFVTVALKLAEANHRFSEGEASEKIFDFLFDSMNQVLPYDRIGLGLLEKEALRLVWVRSKIPVDFLKLNDSIDLKCSSLKEIFATGKSRIISDLNEYLQAHPQSEPTKRIVQDGIRSNLTFPLKERGKVFGVIFFSSCTANIYTPEHERIFKDVADEVAVLMASAKAESYFEKETILQRSMNMIVHDLKSPLSTIQSFLMLAEQEEWYRRLDPSVLKIFQVLQRNTELMKALVGDLSELATLRGNECLEIGMVSLSEFAQDVASFSKMICLPKGIQVEVNASEVQNHVAHFDRIKIQRVVLNLVSNAAKFSSRGSQIEIQLSIKDAHFTCSVRDGGPGIPEKELGSLFKEFGRTSVRPSEGEGSTGLGLAIAKKIVDLHQGTIGVESEVGVGSVFSFWIPIDQGHKLLSGQTGLAH